ncbi:solute carrier family 35 member F2 isoform X1 [Paramormyrops kingsleyae]|uniref:solute carrier family 35 member F2 isoform X1 n=1 Tax=Paramormyrops kingsleyae TaxID=1676925 RepID=UPI000CD617D3|nr:solute carrier family 35 member F2 isoform X1 [Paramormyrops kingsleyae]XP_023648379.1 solute carrier family 35 member F2 isoform X1 [Paramormyrops kingsleyae]
MTPEEPGPTDAENGDGERDVLGNRCWIQKLREVFTWRLLKTTAMGQMLSAMICGSAICSQYLATDFHVNAPMLQNFIYYVLLFLTYSTILACRKGNRNILQILKTGWWRYGLIALADVEANYMLVKAYQYTTLTSIQVRAHHLFYWEAHSEHSPIAQSEAPAFQLLDCFVIPVLMVLSWFILKTRYRAMHYVAVVICLLGVGAMVGADVLSGRDQGSSSDILLGDGLVLVSAVMYAVTNLGQEYSVRQGSLLDFPGMMGLLGTLISGIQCAALEQKDIAAIRWNWKIGLLFAAYALCLFLLYSLMPLVIMLTSATTVNLSLLTSDIFSFFFGVFLFHYTFSGLYMVSFVAILVGFVMFNATTLASTAPVSPAKRDEVQGVIDGAVPCPEVKDGPDGQVLSQDQAGAAEQEVMRSTKI